MDTKHFSWVLPEKLAGSEGPDLEGLRFFRGQGIKHVVRLAERKKAHVAAKDVNSLGMSDFHEPIVDFGSPSQNQINNIVSAVKPWVQAGEPVVVSCGFGQGRTGTVLVCLLLSLGHDFEESIEIVKKRNKDCYGFNEPWETTSQENAVKEYARTIGKL